MYMTDEQKQALKEGRENARNKELNEFKVEQREMNDKILGVLETLVNKDKAIGQTLIKEKEVVTQVPVAEELQALTGKQLASFEKYFDQTDGFKAWYNVNTNVFTIEVPLKFSNTTPAYRVLYKQDLRSKRVDQNNILGSIDNWCMMVAKNLKYNRQIKLK